MINEKFFEIGSDARNLRLGLSTNGINSRGNMSSTHSTGQVMLTIYNLPPWLCMKSNFIKLSLLSQGLRQSENNIHVYFAPLVADLKTTWEESVEVFDAYHQ